MAAALRERGQLYLLSGMDWWAFRRGLYDHMPPLLVGRTAWDNWLLAAALDRGIPAVDASRYVLAVHQGQSQRLDPSNAERVYNSDLYQQAGLQARGELPETDWLLDGAGVLVPRTSKWGRPVLQRQDRYVGTASEIIARVHEQHPLAEASLRQARQRVARCKVEIWPCQAAVLYALARQYNHHGARFLEIGTALGYSAAVLAGAASNAHLTTLETERGRHRTARRNLAPYGNVTAVQRASDDLLADYRGPHWDLIFIDGNQKQIERDLLWWNWLNYGGLLLVHDYTPGHAPVRPCGRVYEALNQFAAVRGRAPDVLQQNEDEVGMAGWYRRDGEPDWGGAW
jgi:predicted O-methyltransferase YrrM